ncbi:Mu-like prophage major head subunit gpT family protein [Phaeobacter sp. J2-8]|uniref:phage major capsid protein n=1 Tax=Phaeobacter sp. J2-8 TaxID=2931394 RepID=UPI001FD14FE4|nr:Mu-like prophage major head subunit gpT family protein [Phaeobacter sp. J2-8]MCJ7871491.1 Mu-like prophage major head subunit gpT family protein [Phaeobacter sp. J2-8]
MRTKVALSISVPGQNSGIFHPLARVLPVGGQHTGNSHPVSCKQLTSFINNECCGCYYCSIGNRKGDRFARIEGEQFMFAKQISGTSAQNRSLELAKFGRGGAGIARAEGNPGQTTTGGSNRAVANGQPSARYLAQIRMAGQRAQLSAAFMDVMADTGTVPANADAVAAGLAQVAQMVAPFAGSAGMDEAAVLSIARRAVLSAAELPSGNGTEIADAIAGFAGQEAAATMARLERPLRPVSSDVTFRGSSGVTRADAMADGLMARMVAGHVPTHGREFANMRLDEMAQLSAGGNYLRGRRNASMFGGAMGTDDFGSALAIASNKVLLQAYEASESQIKRASREIEAPDFRPINSVRVSGGVELGKVKENGEFTAGTITDAGEAFVIETYGKIFTLTRQAIVNDDLGAFEQSATMFGQGAALTEARIFATLLEMNSGAGPVMSDTVNLFDAAHGNLASSGGALSISTLSAARTAMRRQKGLAGEAIRVDPAMLIVPPELETVAEQLVAEIAATTTDESNPFTAKLTVLADAHLTDEDAWYIAALPGRPDGLQHAYLSGTTGPQIFTREGFETDASEFKVRLDFGAGFVDHRAWYKNPGV